MVHHSAMFSLIRLAIYLVIFGVVAVIGLIARASRRRSMAQYSHVPQQTWQQPGPPPGAPYGSWGGQPQPPYPGQPPAQGYGQGYGDPAGPGYGPQPPPGPGGQPYGPGGPPPQGPSGQPPQNPPYGSW
ncbi:hypothetical protein [Actinoallomurus sp. CA-150999]|uniref:hypothetical protein n=1 Tax=Actinoallomurus sp. CA-150999 TaxID=3239887 RepID=UPI003D90DD43